MSHALAHQKLADRNVAGRQYPRPEQYDVQVRFIHGGAPINQPTSIEQTRIAEPVPDAASRLIKFGLVGERRLNALR